MSERDAIVAWLKSPDRAAGLRVQSLVAAADAIERGEYLSDAPSPAADAIVTDADREAAGGVYRALYRQLGAGPVSEVTKDADGVVQAFARHRIAHSPVDEVARLREALGRQCDNMAFVLNKATLPDQWYCKFSNELQEARKALDTRP